MIFSANYNPYIGSDNSLLLLYSPIVRNYILNHIKWGDRTAKCGESTPYNFWSIFIDMAK